MVRHNSRAWRRSVFLTQTVLMSCLRQSAAAAAEAGSAASAPSHAAFKDRGIAAPVPREKTCTPTQSPAAQARVRKAARIRALRTAQADAPALCREKNADAFCLKTGRRKRMSGFLTLFGVTGAVSGEPRDVMAQSIHKSASVSRPMANNPPTAPAAIMRS